MDLADLHASTASCFWQRLDHCFFYARHALRVKLDELASAEFLAALRGGRE